jgi:hypothetical protein
MISRAPFQTRLSQKHSGLGSSLCLSVPPKCVGGRAWSAYAFSRNKTCNTFLATKATKLPTGPARATVEKKTFSCPKIQIAAVRAFQYGSVNGYWISWPHTAQHRPRGGKSHTSLLFCGHLDVSTYPIVWQIFYPASYLQKRNIWAFNLQHCSVRLFLCCRTSATPMPCVSSHGKLHLPLAGTGGPMTEARARAPSTSRRS